MPEGCPRKQKHRLSEMPNTIQHYKIKFNAKNIEDNLNCNEDGNEKITQVKNSGAGEAYQQNGSSRR